MSVKLHEFFGHTTNAAGGPQHDCIITMSVWDSDYVPLSRQGRRTIAGDSLRTAWPLVEER